MSNPLFGKFGAPSSMPNGSPQLNNMQGILGQFNRFKSMFTGNPKEKVEQLLATGQMSPEQFQQLSEMAKQFQQLTGKR